MISLRKVNSTEREGFFRSYRDIGEYLVRHGETGKYHAIPLNTKSIAAIREIDVVRHSKRDIEIIMNGSHY